MDIPSDSKSSGSTTSIVLGIFMVIFLILFILFLVLWFLGRESAQFKACTTDANCKNGNICGKKLQADLTGVCCQGKFGRCAATVPLNGDCEQDFQCVRDLKCGPTKKCVAATTF